ncbi:MAG: tRNA (N(6)-L-threonylcarbamoyladenosine(37)-C(2))-methylthiotransferase MtaB [Tenericutes bacterium]|nr:tRNA (N(6)-L-threonylcarbamoyladenosine(37)-C(2))-methylthiotransferase MtaB [Mycoplasmatota bacterium]
MKSFLIKTLGCKVNAYESEFIRTLLKNNGYKEVSENADICIINTCTVTNTADNKSKQTINNIRKNNNNAIVIAIGCFCQFRCDEITSLIDADIILGNKDKCNILKYIEEYNINKKRIVKFYDMNDQEFEDMEIKEYSHRHRAFVKIEDGCNNFCSYCIIPFVRGRVRSKEYNKCLMEINDLALSGFKEIVLSGIHTGQYNSNNKELYNLINDISLIDQIKRIRLSSVEIVELKEGMMNTIANNKKFVSHLHIPLQSGSDRILKLMNRRYDTNYFLEKVNEIRTLRKDISLTTDVIVGFPGETDEDFNETYEFCKKVKFSKIHVFPYSDREGTKASKMKNKVHGNIKKERVKKLISLSDELEKNYFLSFINKEKEILIEEFKDNYYYGFTDNYIPLKLNGKYEINKIYSVLISKDNINYTTK